MTFVAVEIAVQDVAGVRAAFEAGADRIELAAALEVGGLTPSIGLVEAAVATARAFEKDAPVHVLIRPRAGGFVYTAAELAVMRTDIAHCREAGADGVVIGALDATGEVDTAAVADLVESAGPMIVTFHRALDVVADRVAALQLLADAGVARVLTSGGAARSIDGAAELERLATGSAGLEIMAGGGVRVEDIPELIRAGVDAIHLSARSVIATEGAGPGGGPEERQVTDPEIVRAAVAAVRG